MTIASSTLLDEFCRAEIEPLPVGKEIVARVQILLEKYQQRGDPRRGNEGKTQFHGQLRDMAVVDLIQTVEIGR